MNLTFRLLPICIAALLIACNNESTENKEQAADTTTNQKKEYLSQPLVSHIYTADPSAHVFNGRIYIYPSHDTATGTQEDDLGSHFNMRDYHILSMDSIGGKVTDHGVALHIKDVPWAGRQMWAPDAAYANGKYYLYFPVKDKKDVFRIGVSTSDKPEGPFKANVPDFYLPPKEDVYNNMEALIYHFKIVMGEQDIPKGEVYHCVEGGNGELGFHLISDGGRTPFRLHFRRPCFIIYQAYPEIIKGSMLSDAILTMSSMNVIAGELDA